MTTLRICLLGPPQVFQGDQSVTSQLGQKALGLLAYLALGPSDGYSRDELAGDFWGQTDNEHAAFNLRRCLWSLRKAINPPTAPADTYLRHAAGRYAFNAANDHWIDVPIFERTVTTICRRHFTAAPDGAPVARLLSVADLANLRSAVQLYRGDLLAGYDLPDCPAFSDWLFLERERLRQCYLRGLRALGVENAVRGRYRQAIVDLQQIIAVDPINETAHCDLMVVYHLLGERDRAVDQYHALSNALHELLDVEPLAETLALYAAIRGGALPAAGPSYWLPATGAVAVAAVPGRWPFVGREHEQEALGRALEATARGQGSLVVLRGEGGVGKTRLVEEFLTSNSGSPLVILRANCYAQERGSPYQPVIDALREFLPTADSRHLGALDSLWLTEVARLVPELHSTLPGLPASPPLLADHERHRLFEGLAQFIRHLGERQPVVLFLDDFHTADEPTFDLLHYLARRIASARVLIILALQQEALAERPALSGLLFELGRLGNVVTLPLARLSEAEVLQLVRHTLPKEGKSEALARRLFRETGGNSFFLVELIKDCREGPDAQCREAPVPPSAMDVIRRRLNRLDDEDLRVLSVAAVIGRQFNTRLLAGVYAGAEGNLLAILDRLLSRGWIIDVPGGTADSYEFSHGLVRDAVYHTLRTDWRRLFHHQVGLALEATVNTPESAAELAHHFSHAGEVSRALDYTLRAAAHARAVYGNRDAVAHYRRALEIADQAGIVISVEEALALRNQLGQAHEFLGEYDTAITVYREALPALDLSHIDHRRLRFRLAAALDRKGEYDEALEHLAAIGVCLPAPDHPLARLESAMIAGGIATVYLHREQSHQALAFCRQALALVDLTADLPLDGALPGRFLAERVAVYDTMAHSYFHLGDYDAAGNHYRRALQIARAEGLQPTVAELLLGLAKVARRVGNYAQAQADAQESLDLCLQIGHISGQASSLGALGDIAYNRGDLARAIDYYRQALAIFRQIGDRHGVADYLLSVAFVMIDRDETEQAEIYLWEALEIGRSIDARLVLIRADYHLARVALAHGDLAAAQARAESALAAAQRAGIRLLEAMSVHLLGDLLTRQRRFAEAETHLVESLRLLERLGDRFETACALRSYARLLVERGDLLHGEAHLRRATAILTELGAERELSITNADLARLQKRR
jgi:DNA-binding SARP family transcriptional activator